MSSNSDDRSSTAAAIDSMLRQAPVLPVLQIRRLADAVPLAQALVDGGLPVLEVTLRSDIALAAISAIRRAVPDAIVGAGTVLDPEQLRLAEDAGSHFTISPGATRELYQAPARVPWIPAVATASEIMTGLTFGHQRFKFFPAMSAGGVAALKSFAGPFPYVKFCPTGGIEPSTAVALLALPNVITVGGSWMTPNTLIDSQDWPAIRALAEAAAELRG